MASVKRNIFFLYVLQAANYIAPLVTLPYLTRVLGVSVFGVTGVAYGAVSIMMLLTDWGFSLTATQQVAQKAHDPDDLRYILWNTLGARLILGVVAFICLFIVIGTVPSVRQIAPLLLVSSLQVIPSMFSVGWFLQGLEKMGSFVLASLIGRVLSVPLILLFVKTPSDVAIALLIPGLCGFVSCFVSFREANRILAIFPSRVSWRGIWNQIRGGTKIFISTGAINLYNQSTVLILNGLTNEHQVGIYHGAGRIRYAVQSLIGPASAALFPRINNLIANDRKAAKILMKRMLFGQGGITFLFSIVMFFAAPWGVPFALGAQFSEAIPVVQWLSPLPFLIGISNVLGYNVMLPLGMRNEFSIIICISAVLNFVGMIIFCPLFSAIGAAIAALIAEFFVTLSMSAILYLRIRRGNG